MANWPFEYNQCHTLVVNPPIILVGHLSFILLGLVLILKHCVLFLFNMNPLNSITETAPNLIDLDLSCVCVCLLFGATWFYRNTISHFSYCLHLMWHCAHMFPYTSSNPEVQKCLSVRIHKDTVPAHLRTPKNHSVASMFRLPWWHLHLEIVSIHLLAC